ncbi:hypothetical protein ACFSR7_25530 [Cohnella sp. GCM10020058]|uniref:hypothetical protein n=1 Tax=Cohnella sp. GCM10020058 TaxID=3317330 RepID=UPI00363B0C5E
MCKQSFRILCSLGLVFSLIVSVVSNVSAEAAETTSEWINNEPERTLEQQVSALNMKDWATYVQLEATEDQSATEFLLIMLIISSKRWAFTPLILFQYQKSKHSPTSLFLVLLVFLTMKSSTVIFARTL